MQHARTLVVVLFLAALAAVGFWMLSADDTGPVAPPTGANATPAGAAGGDSAAADAAQGGIGAVPETTARVAAPLPEAGAHAAATGAGLVGQVLDERSNAVAGAVVTLTPGFGGADFDGAEEFDFESALDGDVWRERLANSRRDRTETTTDGEGRFRLAAGGKGSNLQLRVRAPSHVVLDKGVTRPVGKDRDLGVLTLKSGATVAGRVLDRSGSPVVGARVSREDAANGPGGWGDMEFPGFEDLVDTMEPDSAATDAEGRFELPYCAVGKFTLRARHADHPAARLEGLAVEPGARLADVVIVVEPGASIRGRIVGVPEGSKPLRVLASPKPVEGANESGGAVAFSLFGDTNEMFADAGMGFGEKQVRSNADFTFELRGLQVGKTYRVWAAQSGRGFAGNTACTGRSEVAAGTAGLELRYDPGITVTFQVVAAGADTPIERLWVREQLRGGGGMGDFMAYMPRSGRAKAYPEGKVTIANLRPKPKQTLSLTIEALGFVTLERKDIALPVTGAHDLGIVRLEPAPVLQVTVTSGPDRRAVAGANVRLSAADRPGKGEQPSGQFGGIVIDGSGMVGGGGGTRSAKTDRDGRCTINALPGGAMVVNVTSKEFAPYASEPITLPTGKSGSHEVALVRGGSVEVTVVDSDGVVLKEARVEHAPPTGGRSSKQTNQDGVALFEHLSPGAHRFRISTQGGGSDFGPDISFGSADRKPADEPGWQQLAVEDGGKATLQLAKEPMATLRGIVRENGLPLAGARVSFVEGVGDPAPQVDPSVIVWQDEFGGGGNRSVRTGDDGTYQLKDLPAGAHRLRVTAKGRVSPSQVSLALRQGENVVDVDLDVTIVRGTVRDGAGKPVAGATVSIVAAAAGGKVGEVDVGGMFEGMAGLEAAGFGGGRSAVKTGDDGAYELRGVQAGKPLQVRATAKGHAAAKSAIVEVAVGIARDGVDIQLGAAGRIKVTVADAPAFATVQGTLLGAGGEPDAAVGPVMQMMRRGAATLDGLRPGRWKVTLTAPGGVTHEPRIVEVIAGETATLAF